MTFRLRPFDTLSALILIFFTWIALTTAWLSDDILITLRQVWNVIQGAGLTWNFEQRVQGFTHPSWFLLLTLAAAITQELYFTTLILSIVFSVASIAALLAHIYHANQKTHIHSFIAVGLVASLGASKAFTDYMTSGLEAPLSFLLSGITLLLLTRSNTKEPPKVQLVTIYLLLALIFLNRFDYAVLFLPLTLYITFFRFSFKQTGLLILPGIALITAWFSFSIVYFGSPFPNTFYAKLASGYPAAEVLERGIQYFNATWTNDPITLWIIITGIIAGFVSKNAIHRCISLGITLYCLYILKAGGDFMQGRFFAILAYLSVLNLCHLVLTSHGKIYEACVVFVILSLFVATLVGEKPYLSGNDYQNRVRIHGTADERGYYYLEYGLLSKARQWPTPLLPSQTKPHTFNVRCGRLGQAGLTNTNSFIIDSCGLTDAFIARLPAIHKPDWRIGHHHRKIPTGYGEFLIGKVDHIADKELQPLLRDIQLATTGELFSEDRFHAIYRLNISKPYSFNKEAYSTP
ncbi:MAG: hypothetical protein KUG73_13050 [Pseudomonadales bacterium]|nr:hypothetical protein [Pseudomonadales bacterium]